MRERLTQKLLNRRDAETQREFNSKTSLRLRVSAVQCLGSFGVLRSLAVAALIAVIVPRSHFAAAEPAPARPVASPAATRPATRPASGPAATQPRVLQFQPGVRIDWSQHQVEADVTVILREGLIELFACSPKQREHEAIVRLEARPTHLYQALGLIGLTPGRPDHFDAQQKFVPASGDFVDVEIRYAGADGQPRQEPIEAWMRPADGDASLGRLPWVFAGSTPTEDRKGIATDLEGTVIALVEFSSSLIALPEYHSESNDELWVRPRTTAIPPIGSKGQLIIRAAPLRLRVEAGGQVRAGAKLVTRAELADLVKRRLQANAALRVEVTAARAVEVQELKMIAEMLHNLGIQELGVEILDESGKKRPIMR